MAYQSAWEWPVAIAHVSALIAGGWSGILMPARERPAPHAQPLEHEPGPQAAGA